MLTLALVGSILFGVHVVLLPWLGQTNFAAVALLGRVVLAISGLLLRRGKSKLASAVGWAVVASNVVVLHLTYGRAEASPNRT